MTGQAPTMGENPAAPATGGNSVSPLPDLRLRAERPRVVRLNRTVVWALGGAGMLAIGLALGYALENSSHKAPPAATQDTDVRPSADGLAGLPSDYVGNGVPKLGPALPGDLGHTILKAQGQGKVASGGEDRRAAQEVEAAVASRLFVQTGERDRAGKQATLPAPGAPASQGRASTTTGPQAGNLAFLEGQPDRATTSPDRIAPPASPYVLQAGTVIAGALNTKISSDLPGQIVGHVTQNVYDSPTGRYLLIPQGSTLFGAYNSGISFGQQRTQIIWTRLIFPDGESLVLEKLPGGDAIGQSGLSDEVNNHWGQLFKAALVTTLLSVGSEAGTSWNENNLMQAIRSGASNGFSMVGNRLIDRSLNVQPTLTDRPGLPFTVILGRDLLLKSYQNGGNPR
ncbi:conjugal transfer protein TrbI [Gluconacetobacter liquefaciens]|uniref:Type IV secretion system protein VirB10 n=2 Tax=Gluconacetobacter liquefaciens TaxID=89584 RepID=A0A370G677_GLULI|nr:type IV secretion system protein VirB10 [Gluconacetobacter liquefaciens]GBQ93447.1 conjugal transfer protein TrbI [Gluconacetobacter liquefaciens NRIC 0522]GEB38096.1 conjugal transfer protein TrbI [Gluconacetobacter liquefaciens]